jgi:hypothetical protein
MSAAAITQFIRHTPRPALETYLGNHAPQLSGSFTWPQSDNDHVKPLLQAVDTMDRDERELLRHNAERINEMTDEEGQNALLSVVTDQNAFNARENAHDRAMWVFINNPTAFRHAEETRYANHNRLGRMWDGFVGPKNQNIASDPLNMEMFRARLADIFGKDTKMKIEAYRREVIDEEDSVALIDQIVVYKEGLPDSYQELEKDELVVKIRRPVYELIICYEPENGVIEVIAQGKEQRESIARLFSEVLLGVEIEGARIPLRQYDISSLSKQRNFPTDPEDGIESVKVVSVKLKPTNGAGSLIIDIPSKHSASIHQQSQEWFQQNDPFKNGFIIHMAKIVVQFYPLPGERRGKAMPLKITMPNRCDLKSRTERERMIGEKYLQRWGLLKEI